MKGSINITAVFKVDKCHCMNKNWNKLEIETFKYFKRFEKNRMIWHDSRNTCT